MAVGSSSRLYVSPSCAVDSITFDDFMPLAVMPSPNVVWPESCCFCSHLCVRVRVLKHLLTRYLAEYLRHFHQTYISDALWDRWVLHNLGSTGQRSRSWWNKVCWKQHFLGLLTRCLEKHQSDFHETYISDVVWDRDKCVKFWGQKVSSRSLWNNIYWNRHCTGGGIQYSTSRVELDFLVLSCQTFPELLHVKPGLQWELLKLAWYPSCCPTNNQGIECEVLFMPLPSLDRAGGIVVEFYLYNRW